MLLLGFIYLFLIAIIVLFIFLIVFYSGQQANFVYLSDNPEGDIITSLTIAPVQLEYNNTSASYIPINNYRRKKIKGKFVLDISAEENVDILLEVRDRGSIIGEQTRYTIWKTENYGVSKISLFFVSNELNGDESHDLQIFGNYVTNSNINVKIHDIKIFYF